MAAFRSLRVDHSAVWRVAEAPGNGTVSVGGSHSGAPLIEMVIHRFAGSGSGDANRIDKPPSRGHGLNPLLSALGDLQGQLCADGGAVGIGDGFSGQGGLYKTVQAVIAVYCIVDAREVRKPVPCTGQGRGLGHSSSKVHSRNPPRPPDSWRYTGESAGFP